MRLWLVANNDDSRRPLQRPLAHIPGGRGADEEGGVKATISGRGGGMEGKTTRIIARYSGSAPDYRKRCEEVVAAGYAELALG